MRGELRSCRGLSGRLGRGRWPAGRAARAGRPGGNRSIFEQFLFFFCLVVVYKNVPIRGFFIDHHQEFCQRFALDRARAWRPPAAGVPAPGVWLPESGGR